MKTLTPNIDCRNSGQFTLVIFDLRIPGAVARLHSERAAWQGCADIQMLDFDHSVLIVRPGATRSLASW